MHWHGEFQRHDKFLTIGIVNLNMLDFAGAADALKKRLARMKTDHLEIRSVASTSAFFYLA